MKNSANGILAVLSFLLFPLMLNAQRKALPYGAQPDLRFVVTGEMSSIGDDEAYYFYVLNTANEEYRIKVRVTLDLACYGQQQFYLGWDKDQWIYLKPGGRFNGNRDDKVHVFMGAKAESRKNCVLKDENGKLTFFKGFTFWIHDVENLTVKKAQEAIRLEDERLAKQRAEEEKKKLAEEKRKADEAARLKQQEEEQKRKEAIAKANQEAEKKKQEEQKKNTTNQDDFWSEKKKTNTEGNNASTNPNYHKLPDVFYTTNGQYWKKRNGEIVEITKDEYISLKNSSKLENQNSANLQQQQQQQANEERQKAIDKYIADNRAREQFYQKQEEDIKRKYDVNIQANQMQQGINESKQALNENSSMIGNYQSVEQVMAEFRQKMAAINQTSNQLNQQRQDKLNYVTNNYYAKDDYAGQVASQGMQVLGTIFNNAKANKERKEAQAQLRAEKEAALRHVQEQERKMISGIRTDLFKRFKEAAFPASNSKIQANTLYFFAYSYDPALIGAKNAVLYVSNVFQVDKYSDGTWPFKNSIVGDISKLTPFTEVIHGYYFNANEAEQMRQAMMSIFKESYGGINLFTYRGKKSLSSSSSSAAKLDFWETGKKHAADSTKKQPADSTKKTAKDDFWKN